MGRAPRAGAAVLPPLVVDGVGVIIAFGQENALKEGHPDGVLGDIQRAVATETGVRIGSEAAARLQQVLSAAPREAGPPMAAGNSRDVTVLLTDLRGFTAISEAYPAHIVVEALNRYLTRMVEIVVSNGGTIDKFMGDAVMVLFGAHRRNVRDPLRAVTCAVQMQIAMAEINRDNAAKGFPPIFMGAGINTGAVMAGLLGSDVHNEYTVIGDQVNLASRIESFSLRGQVLISDATYRRCRGFVVARESMLVHVKGKSKPVQVREVQAIPSLGLTVPRQTLRDSPRVEVRIPFTYQLVVDKIVLPEKHKATIRDLGYQGILGKVTHDLKADTDILVEFDLPLIGGRVRDLYAKVCHVRHHGGHHLAGIEFTSVTKPVDRKLRHFVQLLIQGHPEK